MKIKLTPQSYQENIYPVRKTATFLINGFQANSANADFTHCYFTDYNRTINKGLKLFEHPCLIARMDGTIEVEIIT
jgi:hypothetical protein